MRGQLASVKGKVDANLKAIEEINESIVKQKNKILELPNESERMERLDREILEMRYKLKQVKLSESKGESKINKSDKYVKTKF